MTNRPMTYYDPRQLIQSAPGEDVELGRARMQHLTYAASQPGADEVLRRTAGPFAEWVDRETAVFAAGLTFDRFVRDADVPGVEFIRRHHQPPFDRAAAFALGGSPCTGGRQGFRHTLEEQEKCAAQRGQPLDDWLAGLLPVEMVAQGDECQYVDDGETCQYGFFHHPDDK